MAIDIMDLPETEMGNCHVDVFQDFLTKWPMVFPVPDQRALRLAKLLAEEIVSLEYLKLSFQTEVQIYCPT